MTPDPAPPIPKPKHVPERTCAACRKKRPQRELLRFTRRDDGTWQMDWFPAGRQQVRRGRGVYLCADTPACWQEKRLQRAFRAQAAAVAAQLAAFGHLREVSTGSSTAPAHTLKA